MDSKNLAGMLGPALIAVSISEGANLRILQANSSPAVIYLNGTLLFLAGLAVVRAHNRWRGGWPVLVTLVGWLLLLGGLLRMGWPGLAQTAAQNALADWAMLLGLLIVGITLTYKAFGP